MRLVSPLSHSIWTYDETGFTTVAKVGKVRLIATKGVRQVRKMSSAQRGSNITALCCMNAAGSFVPYSILFSYFHILFSYSKLYSKISLFVPTATTWVESN